MIDELFAIPASVPNYKSGFPNFMIETILSEFSPAGKARKEEFSEQIPFSFLSTEKAIDNWWNYYLCPDIFRLWNLLVGSIGRNVQRNEFALNQFFFQQYVKTKEISDWMNKLVNQNLHHQRQFFQTLFDDNLIDAITFSALNSIFCGRNFAVSHFEAWKKYLFFSYPSIAADHILEFFGNSTSLVPPHNVMNESLQSKKILAEKIPIYNKAPYYGGNAEFLNFNKRNLRENHTNSFKTSSILFNVNHSKREEKNIICNSTNKNQSRQSETESQPPAWVLCTRYSDRPCAGKKYLLCTCYFFINDQSVKILYRFDTEN